MLNICRKIFDELMVKGVKYCHWKSNEHLAEGLNGKTDLDILVSDSYKKKFSDILADCECIKVCPQFGSRYAHVEEWLGYDRKTGNLIHLHIHFKMITGSKYVKEYILPWHDVALRTRVLREGIYIMNPNLELVTLYIRIVLKEQRVISEMDRYVLSDAYRKEILWLKEQIDVDELSEVVGIVWKEKKDNVLRIYLKSIPEKSDWVILQEYAEDMIKPVNYRRFISNYTVSTMRKQFISLKYLLKDFLGIVPFTLLKSLKGKGLVFVFVGCDGSGKSSVTQEISKWLGWKLDCQRFYFGIGEGYKKPAIYKLSEVIWLPIKFRKICKMLYFYQVSLRCVYMRKVIDFYVDRGGIAICDRYPQTQFKGIYDGPKIQALKLNNNTGFGKFFIKMEEKNIERVGSNKIDCVFKLSLSAEKALKRSPKHRMDDIKRKVQITEKLQFPKSNVYKIDAMQSYEKEILEIKGIIWDKIIENHS